MPAICLNSAGAEVGGHTGALAGSQPGRSPVRGDKGRRSVETKKVKISRITRSSPNLRLHSPGLAGKAGRKAPDRVVPRSVNVSAAGVYPGCASTTADAAAEPGGCCERVDGNRSTQRADAGRGVAGRKRRVVRFRVVRRHFARAHTGVFFRDMRLVSHCELLIDGESVEPMAVVPAHPFSATFVGKVAVHG